MLVCLLTLLSSAAVIMPVLITEDCFVLIGCILITNNWILQQPVRVLKIRVQAAHT